MDFAQRCMLALPEAFSSPVESQPSFTCSLSLKKLRRHERQGVITHMLHACGGDLRDAGLGSGLLRDF